MSSSYITWWSARGVRGPHRKSRRQRGKGREGTPRTVSLKLKQEGTERRHLGGHTTESPCRLGPLATTMRPACDRARRRHAKRVNQPPRRLSTVAGVPGRRDGEGCKRQGTALGREESRKGRLPVTRPRVEQRRHLAHSQSRRVEREVVTHNSVQKKLLSDTTRD